MSTVRAAVVTDFEQPLTIVDRPLPSPGPGQVLVRVEACGLCRIDVHAAHGDWPVQPVLPFVPGHEGVGIVEDLGAGVLAVTVGQRVAMPWLGSPCGTCRTCLAGRQALCEVQQHVGYSVDGAFAERVVVDARSVVAVPDGIEPIDAAPLTCAGVTAYKALRAARVAPGDVVAVFGIGGPGHLAVQYARLLGASVIAVDVERSRLDLAGTLGAEHLIDAATADPVERIELLGGADVALVLTASPTVFAQALASLRRGGRLVCDAMPARGSTVPVPSFEASVQGVSVIGSIIGTRQDVADVFRLHLEGRTTVVTRTIRLGDVDAALAEVLAESAPTRIVLDFAPALAVRAPAGVPVPQVAGA